MLSNEEVRSQLTDHLLLIRGQTEAALVLLGTNPTQPEAAQASRGLRNPSAFFAKAKTLSPLGPSLSQAEVDGCNRVLGACAAHALPLSHAAYVLATEFHETAGTMWPIREYGRGEGKEYGKPGRNNGQRAYGRGDVQLTWDENYEEMDKTLGLGGKLIADYDLALEPKISADIMVVGMVLGKFTGKALIDYLPENRKATADEFFKARRIVNGTDKAQLIANYAVNLQEALEAGQWER